MTFSAPERGQFNVSREQWRETWRDARVMASLQKAPTHFHHNSLMWHAWMIAAVDRYPSIPTTPRMRLSWKKNAERITPSDDIEF